MRNKYIISALIIFIYFSIMLSFVGCTTTKYIPVESIKTEYISKLQVDTFIQRDSIIQKEKGDTFYIEKIKWLYRNKIVNDTIIVHDSIPVIKEVEVIKEVNKIKEWQSLLMILGGGVIAIGGYKLFKLIKV